MQRRAIPFATAIALAVLLAGCAGEAPAPEPDVEALWAEAREAAGEDGYVLVDFFATWCGPCKAFDAALHEDPALRAAIDERVAFVQIDAEKGFGETLADGFGVTAYPTFVLADADGALVDRWSGYGDPEGFLASLDEALVDPMPVEARAARFEAEPTVDDALELAAVFENSDDRARARGYFLDALDLDPARSGEVLPSLAYVEVAMLRDDGVTLDDVRATARALFADDGVDDARKVDVALMLDRAAARHEAPDLATEFLPVAMAIVEGSGDEDVAAMRDELGIAHALAVLDDPQAALEIKRASMPDGWNADAGQLNSFAWWCFEHEVNVAEAIELARKGVDLAEPGSEKAMILDTLAELCNLGGDCDEAIAAIDRAIAEDPDRDYYQEQRERFAAILAGRDGSAAATTGS